MTLPTRQTVHAPPVAIPVKRTADLQQHSNVNYDQPDDSPSWDDKIGQVGVVLIAIAACAAAWAVMTFLL
jgi:hypothetical protein